MRRDAVKEFDMAKGGARVRSGPAPDPNSERSERRGYVLTALPSEGYAGPVPDFPLPGPSDREIEVWEWAWRTPQACAWSLASEAWRVRQVAEWVRLSVRCEAPDASASLVPHARAAADEIGFTTRGLQAMGWKVAADEVADKRDTEKPRPSSRERMKVVRADGA
jgi:hypothetical protein